VGRRGLTPPNSSVYTDMTTVATFLASNDAKWVTGERVRVGGGLR